MITSIDGWARACDAVATVGRIEAKPGAPNVIPGQVDFTVDIRSADDGVRQRIVNGLLDEFRQIAGRHGVIVNVTRMHETSAVACDDRIVDQFAAAVAKRNIRPFRLRSGAGHDAASFDAVCPIGVLFVRCRDGISHNPEESITTEDADLAVRVLVDFVRHFHFTVPLPDDRKACST
jgi:allantoate deiminase